MASIQVLLLPDECITPIQRRLVNNLPAHVKGSATWLTQPGRAPGYYATAENNKLEPVELLNNEWYHLGYIQRSFGTRTGLRLERGTWGLGYWHLTDPQHPDFTAPSCTASCTGFCYNPSGFSSGSSGSSTASAHTAKSVESIHEPNSPAIPAPTLSLAAASVSFRPITVDPPENPPTTMSVNATTTTGSAPTNGLKGTAPAIFNGDRVRSEAFWNEFRHYCLLNRNNKSISIPFNRVLTALSYIKGPLMEDWVNAQASTLEEQVDTMRAPHIAKTDEVLWTEFESDFKSAWKDTAHTQSAYDQLMKLQMKELDVNTYNATFERLANAAEWEPDTKGTIACYRAGLRENVHQRVVNRENLPTTMVEWKSAARKEVGRIKELQSTGLIGPHQNQPHEQHAYQTGNQRMSHSLSNSQHVPMDIDSANITVPFRKLTDKEHAKYCAKGRCFRCHTQGHMARNCPKNSYNTNCPNSNTCKSTTSTPTVATVTPAATIPTPAPSAPPPVPPKQSLTQQI
jgi:hypothetical protein